MASLDGCEIDQTRVAGNHSAALTFAREGASDSLAGRTQETLYGVSAEIRAAGRFAAVTVVENLIGRIGEMNMSRRAPGLAQVAEVAAFLASDRASAMTGTIIKVTCGMVTG